MRSKLFVPGSRPELFEKALVSAADGLSFDLEDAVVPARKAEARIAVAAFIADTARQQAGNTGRKRLIVRSNAVGTAHFNDDLETVAVPGLDWLNLPKVEDPDEVRTVARRLRALEVERALPMPIGILVNIESPVGLRRVHAIAQADSRIVGLQIGFGDMLTGLGVSRDPHMLAHMRIAVRLAAAEAGVPAFDSAFIAIADKAGFEADAKAARALGFAGKSCVHPAQIEAANAMFAPTEAEIKEAQTLLDAARQAGRQGVGAFTIDGLMIDRPFIRRAEEVLADARRFGLLGHATGEVAQ